MKMGSLFLTLAIGVAAAAFAAKPVVPVVTENYDWRDGVTNLVLEGRGFLQTAAPYTRLPEKFKEVVTSKVWGLSQTAIGFNARFTTDSDEIVIRWKVREKIHTTMFFTPIMYCGVDVYARRGGGKWTHMSAAAPDFNTGVGELRLRWRKGDECLVYLPIRARPESFSIGVKKGASFGPARPHATTKPIVHYGTSIVNGGAASRPGLIFTSIMSRRLDMEVINLGFSGAGKMELPMADLVAEIDAELYIVDCDWNMNRQVQEANYEPFVRRLKELRPDTPVLLCGGCTEKAEPRDGEVFSRGVYDRLKAEDPAKWANWHYLSGVEMLPNDDECTHDHCHPNDYGFIQMGRVYAETVKKILKR